MLIYLYNMHLFYATLYKLVHVCIQKASAATAAAHGSFLYTNTAWREGGHGSSKGDQQMTG